MTILMHHHIFKNAGTTVDWVLHRNFPGGVLHIEGDHPGARLTRDQIAGVAREHSDHKAISSHSSPLPDSESSWAKIHFTMLRDPIDRLYSMYRFQRQRPDDRPIIRVAKERSFSGYCEWFLRKPDSLISNWQARCCTPQPPLLEGDRSRRGKGWVADLDAARAVLSTSVFVGTVEDFDESMLLLEAVMRRHGIAFDAAYIRKNTAPRETQGEPQRASVSELLGQSLHEHLIELNSMDYELLELARGGIRAQLSALDDPDQALEGFRERCRALADCPEAGEVYVPGRDKWLRAL